MKFSFLSGAHFSLTVSSISLNFFDKLFVFSNTRALSPGKPWLEISFKRFCKTSRSFLRSSNSDVDSYKISTWDVAADTENRPVAVKGEGLGRGGVGVWDQQRQTPKAWVTAQHGELHSVSDDKPQWKRIWKRTYVFVYIHKYPFSTIWEMTLHMDITKWPILKSNRLHS